MVKWSLQASQAGIQQAKKAFARKGWTQENLALEVNLKTRQPVWRFFSGRPVERHTFIEICSILELNWREIAENPPEELSEPQEQALFNSDALVQQVRSQRFDKIQNQCGTLQLLDISRPVGVEDIYIDVNILEEIASQQWLEIADLKSLTPEKFDRFGLGEVSQKQISGMKAVETYSKLRVLGKPGYRNLYPRANCCFCSKVVCHIDENECRGWRWSSRSVHWEIGFTWKLAIPQTRRHALVSASRLLGVPSPGKIPCQKKRVL